ncbi:hypothetical protein DIPPA_23445 [Diplonema papillatum]|nr:hypothetical protein DIPPA_23445 [Diplonema papillatum]
MMSRMQTLVLLASLAALHRILRSTAAVSTLMIYGSTTPEGAYDREVNGEICHGVTLYAAAYPLDASDPSLRWVASVYAPNVTDVVVVLSPFLVLKMHCVWY